MAVAARKPQFYFLLDFSKLKTLGQVLDLFSKLVDKRVSSGKTDEEIRNFSFENQFRVDFYNPLKMHFLTIILHLCVVIVIPKMHVKRSF